MLAVVAERRRDGRSSFVQLVSYTILRDDVEMKETLSPEKPFVRQSRSEDKIFSDLLEYATRNALPDSPDILATFSDGRQQMRCGEVICETNCFSLATASTEMDMVAMQNTRCLDPVYHVILSWPESERPTSEQIFDSARYCLKRMGMEGHQYVFAIHDDTDNLHCHLTVNRVNPVSYKAASLYNDHFTLDRCCRELELIHGWKHDNGAFVVSAEGDVVRRTQDYKSGPRAARQLEHFGDAESLYTYAVQHCRERLDTLLNSDNVSWYKVHDILVDAGLELRRKGEGLAVYDNSESPTDVPVKASRLHPGLTLSSLEPRIGAFKDSPKAEYYEPDKLLYGWIAERYYDPCLHVRDRGARIERRQERAIAREDLKARYKAYKNGWVRPVLLQEDVRARYQALSADFKQRRETLSLITDPLLRKMLHHALAVDRMIATAALRVELKAEREALKASPDHRPQSYRQWVEVQAVAGDRAAISQLRGWAYRAKRSELTPVHKEAVLRCGVADDIAPLSIQGYETKVSRDGAITYLRDGKSVMVDKGERIEVTGRGKNDVAAAFWLTERKSGEVLEVRGSRGFVDKALQFVPEYNQTVKTKLPLTHPAQRAFAGYDQPQPKPAEPEHKARPKNGPAYRP